MMISGQNMKKKKKYEDEYLNVHLQMALQFCTLCHKLVEKRKLDLRRMVLVLIPIYWFSHCAGDGELFLNSITGLGRYRDAREVIKIGISLELINLAPTSPLPRHPYYETIKPCNL